VLNVKNHLVFDKSAQTWSKTHEHAGDFKEAS
jgi:hypothetical protein